MNRSRKTPFPTGTIDDGPDPGIRVAMSNYCSLHAFEKLLGDSALVDENRGVKPVSRSKYPEYSDSNPAVLGSEVSLVNKGNGSGTDSHLLSVDQLSRVGPIPSHCRRCFLPLQ